MTTPPAVETSARRNFPSVHGKAPFILVNSVVALVGAVLAGQVPASDTASFAPFALQGAAAGTAIGLRWMSAAATRNVIAVILVLAGGRLLIP